MAAERKAFELKETATGEAQEGEKRPSCSPQSLDRKLLWVANREIAGWELDCQAEVN